VSNTFGENAKATSRINLVCEPLRIIWWQWPPWRKARKSSRAGQSIVFESEVTSTAGTATGSVTFREDSKVLGMTQLNGSGIASLTVSDLAWGNHNIVAWYSGDDRVSEGSTSVYIYVKHGWSEIQHIWSCLQSFVTILALFAAGWWALHRYNIERQPALEMRVIPQKPEAMSGGEFLIRGEIFVKNVGSEPAFLNLANGPLFVAEIESIPCGASPNSKEKSQEQDLGKIRFRTSRKFWLSRPSVDDPDRPDYENYDQIRSGATDIFHFMVTVPKAGKYAILFSPGSSQKEWNVLKPWISYRARWEPPTVFVDVP